MSPETWPDKQAVISCLIEQLEEELVAMTRMARDAAKAATHEENRAEGDKDMRATEASYVARGQASRVEELEHSVLLLRTVEMKRFDSTTPIQTSAMVCLVRSGRESLYLLVPAGGGRRVTLGESTVCTLIPSSPLGAALLGLVDGDEVELDSPTDSRVYQISAVR
jgi:transcription elongation GreA/GreB family factor